MKDKYTAECVQLLKNLIKTQSFSGEETGTAEHIVHFFDNRAIKVERVMNNVLVKNKHFDENKPTILINSHHDTVKVVEGWTHGPFSAKEEEGKIYGLGSNDAGASLISLIACFLHFYEHSDLDFNLILAATAEEENSGPHGVRCLLDDELKNIYCGIVGEPTGLRMAVAEKGLVVLDGIVHGVAGHAARKEGENAIYKAMQDVLVLKDFKYDKVSPFLGENVLSVSKIEGGKQHNITPDFCTYLIDLRVNDQYTLKEAVQIIQEKTIALLKPRSLRYHPSSIDMGHPLVERAKKMNITTFGSATLSDQTHMSFPTVKIGPGDSSRSHTADEYILISEIQSGIETYIQLLSDLKL